MLAVLAAIHLGPATASATAAVPSVDVEVRDTTIEVKGADALGRGPVRLRLSGAGPDGARTVAVVAFDHGVTAADVEEVLDTNAMSRVPWVRSPA